GAGIYIQPEIPENTHVALTNCTLSGGMAQRDGGGIANLGATVTLTNVTVTLNSAVSGGGLANLPFVGGKGQVIGPFTLVNTIVSANSSGGGPGPDLSGPFISGGHNLLGSTTGATITGNPASDIIGQDPKLGPLVDNGGPTLPHALLPGSPAIDAADV